jgi:hypothetical protein
VAGEAAFSNFSMNILIAGGGSGDGIAVDKMTEAKIRIKVAEVQAGDQGATYQGAMSVAPGA